MTSAPQSTRVGQDTTLASPPRVGAAPLVQWEMGAAPPAPFSSGVGAERTLARWIVGPLPWAVREAGVRTTPPAANTFDITGGTPLHPSAEDSSRFEEIARAYSAERRNIRGCRKRTTKGCEKGQPNQLGRGDPLHC